MIVAARLQPAAQGLGTHHQLGLPPCTTRILWGVRCPACGMTTSWAHFVRGEWKQSAAANCGGLLLAILTVASLPFAGLAAMTGSPPSRSAWVALAAGGLLVLMVTLAEWTLRLWLE
jgi:hypothetical protein